MTKEQVLMELKDQGFELEDAGEFGYHFKFEELNFLYLPDEDDEDFIRFAVPNIYEVTEENRPFLLEVINDTNMTVKHSKTCISFENVWTFYEHRLFGDDKLEDIIEHAVRLLQVTVGLFFRRIEGDDSYPYDEEDSKKGKEE